MDVYVIVLFGILKATGATTWRNCEDWRLHGYTKSADFYVDPKKDGNKFPVFCDMTTIPAQTVFKHDFSPREHVGFSIGGWYADVKPQYYVTMENIESALSLTAGCQQFIKYECNTSKLNLEPTYSKWESRDSVKQYYWGDADLQSGYCACGLSGTCANPAKKCNCLINDDTLREDSGYLTDSSVLPVTRVVIRMSSKASTGYLTIGPMTCTDVDPRGFVETPEGIATLVICSVLFLIFLFMVTYACYKRRPCCKRQSKDSIKKLSPALRPTVEPSVEASHPGTTSTPQSPSPTLLAFPRGPLHAIMPPSYTVHNFPLESYKPGELSSLLGARTEADLVQLRMQLNARSIQRPPSYRKSQKLDQERSPSRTEISDGLGPESEGNYGYNWNIDNVLLVRSLIAREQAARVTSNTRRQQHSATKTNTESTRSSKHMGVSLSNIDDLDTNEEPIITDETMADRTDTNYVSQSPSRPESSNINYNNIQMVKDVIAREKKEKESAQSNTGSRVSNASRPTETDVTNQSKRSSQSRDDPHVVDNGDWD
uniref:Uncharacterized protein LOC111108674 n=1 Tax=Crassostrea virginica TaxID=6565 RepID=A0A8B8BAG4_CRAVI|nr:uncharacterized protein LOC111108674 [Crassostrea virginica]